METKLISDEHVESLNAKVNALAKKGWEPNGYHITLVRKKKKKKKEEKSEIETFDPATLGIYF